MISRASGVVNVETSAFPDPSTRSGVAPPVACAWYGQALVIGIVAVGTTYGNAAWPAVVRVGHPEKVREKIEVCLSQYA